MEVLDGTGECGNPSCCAVSVRNFLCCIGEKRSADFAGVAVEVGKEDPELGASGLRLRGSCGSGRAAF